ncbi:tetratricopeptide repeat protein [Micromonospora echinospora]|uniref:tetratricopeptide repeat protein n=1 Tax=Micromonospora echinospora TaxID=1877 RepID=UPI003A8C0CF6
MEPTVSAGLAKALGSAVAPLARLIGKRTVRWRVAWTVGRQARKKGIRLKAGQLRKWLTLPEVQKQLSLGGAEVAEAVIDGLAGLLDGSADQRRSDAEQVFSLVLAAFVRAHDPATAAAISGDWLAERTRVATASTQAVVAESNRSILDRMSASNVFGDQVNKLQPWRRDQAIEIRGSWPDVERLVQAIVTTDDRAALLRQWCEQPPDWFSQAPEQVVCWLADLACDYGQNSTAARLFGIAVKRGAYPAGFWKARQAMCLPEDAHAEADELLASAAGEHPLAQALLFVHRESWDQAVNVLDAWQTTSNSEAALRLQLLARLHARAGDINRGITFALDAAAIEGASGAALHAAELLLYRAQHGTTVNRLADTEQAAALAIKARNVRQSWHGDSVAAILVAVNAYILSGKVAQARALIEPKPSGDAWPHEAADPRLRREKAELLAVAGEYDQARALAAELGSAFVVAMIEAVRLTDAADDTAAAAWQAALAAVESERDFLVAVRGLAHVGGELPDLAEVEQQHPALVREIRDIHRTMGVQGGTIEALRAGAAGHAVLAVLLAERYGNDGEHLLAAEVLKEAAHRWNDPGMMLSSARHLRTAKEPEAAIRAAERGLTMGGPVWAGQFAARVLIFEIHVDEGSWDLATEQARSLVALDPDAVDARWALVHSLIRRGDRDSAWNALTPDGDPVAPRDRHDALTWIGLVARHDTSTQFVPRALSTMARWPEDEQLIGVFIAQIFFGLHRQGLSATDQDLAALHTAMFDYTERFPDSTVFRRIPISDDDPLRSLTPDLRARHESLSQAIEALDKANLPLGFLATAFDSSYTEASLKRGAGFVNAHAREGEAYGSASAAAALNKATVIDLTAAHTLALLDPQLRSQLISGFAQVRATDEAYRDAVRGQESLGLRSTMSTGWDPDAERPTVAIIEQSTADRLAEQSSVVYSILHQAARRPWPRLTMFPDVDQKFEWLSSLDLAAAEQIPFWCDDHRLRSVAASMGVPTFGTVDLLRFLQGKGYISRQLRVAAEAILITNYYTDLGFDRATFDLAAAIDGHIPRGAAFALTRPATWNDPEAALDFMLAMLRLAVINGPDQVEGWVSATAIGLVRITTDDHSASANLRVLMGRCMAEPWMNADHLLAVLRGVRAGVAERHLVTDPFKAVAAGIYRNLVSHQGHPFAMSMMMALAAQLTESDKAAVSRVILTHRD